jgi:hypothetical protein
MFSSGLAPKMVYTAVDKVFKSEFNYDTAPGRATARTGGVFMQDTIDRAAIVTEQYQGTGYYQTRQETQAVPQGSARVGNTKTSSVVNYDKAISISKNFFDDDQHSTIAKLMTDEGRLARISQDNNAFAVYNNAFSGQKTNDAVALYSDSHVTLNGTTVDNLETGVLNNTNLNTLFISLKKQKTQDGTIGGFEPSILLVPTELHKTATEITESDLRTGTANNDLNYYSKIYPGLQVFESPFLSSTVSYFLLSRSHSVTRWVRNGIQTTMVDWSINANNDYIYKVGFREMCDSISYEGTVASNGTV